MTRLRLVYRLEDPRVKEISANGVFQVHLCPLRIEIRPVAPWLTFFFSEENTFSLYAENIINFEPEETFKVSKSNPFHFTDEEMESQREVK